MQIAVIGTGYVGLVTGACFSELGHEVICHDIDQRKIAKLKEGIIPIYEPGLDELVRKNQKEGRLTFTTTMKDAVQYASVVMSCVGTPPDKDHKADLQYVKDVASSFAEHLNGYQIFVNKSTVPVGTAEVCRQIIEEKLKSRNSDAEFDVVSNPEFLREGQAISDTFHPDRVVIGAPNSKAKGVMEKVYEPLISQGKNVIFTDIRSAEIIKYAANAFLATKISFINEVAEFCEKSGGNIQEVAKGIGLDHRIGKHFLRAGIGYGGSCFPKDVKALIQSGKEYGADFSLIKGVEDRNEKQKLLLIEKFHKHFPSPRGVKIAFLGLAFKPETDDIRSAPAISIIEGLLKLNVDIQAYDPQAMDNFKLQQAKLAEKITLCENLDQAIEGADCLMLITEWPEFIDLDLQEVATKMKGRIILDGRNAFSREQIERSTFSYEGIGLPQEIDSL